MTPLPRRRALLDGVTAFGLVFGGGCVTRSPLSSAKRIVLAFGNESSADVLVQFSITSEGAVVSDGEVRVSRGEYRTVDTRIDTTGRYELGIEGDGGFRSTHPVRIEEYDIRTGSNLVVEIYDDDTELMMEE